MADVDSESTEAEADVELKDPEDTIDSERMPRVVPEIEDDSMHSQAGDADIGTVLAAVLENKSTDVTDVEETAVAATKTEDSEDIDNVALVQSVEVDSKGDEFRMLAYRESG